MKTNQSLVVMDKTIFYAPNIDQDHSLPSEEAAHCVRVLRKQIGDELYIADGKGSFYDATIVGMSKSSCEVAILKRIETLKSWNNSIHIAFAPTKNIDRVEWFLEKATEIGCDMFTPLLCRFSERKQLKLERLEKIIIAAMKQSQKAYLPILNELTPFNDFVKQPFTCEKYIAHCYENIKRDNLVKIYPKNSDVLILIGPEGDFSEQEVNRALKNNFKSISLSNSRLRTETAALVACHVIHVLNSNS